MPSDPSVRGFGRTTSPLRPVHVTSRASEASLRCTGFHPDSGAPPPHILQSLAFLAALRPGRVEGPDDTHKVRSCACAHQSAASRTQLTALTVRATSSSVVRQLQTLIRITRLPFQVTPPKKASPLALIR
jgi:hypothetical protein